MDKIIDTSSEVIVEMTDTYTVLKEFENVFGIRFCSKTHLGETYIDWETNLNHREICCDNSSFKFRDRFYMYIDTVKNNFEVCEELYNKRFTEYSNYYNNLKECNVERIFLSSFYKTLYMILYYAYAELYISKSEDSEFTKKLFFARDNRIVRRLGGSTFNRDDILFKDNIGKTKYEKIELPNKLFYKLWVKNIDNVNKISCKVQSMYLDGLLSLYEMELCDECINNKEVKPFAYEFAYKIANYEN